MAKLSYEQYKAKFSPPVKSVPAPQKSWLSRAGGYIAGKTAPVLGAISNVLSRGNWASANMAKTNLEINKNKKLSNLERTPLIGNAISAYKMFSDPRVLSAGLRGLKGQDKTTYSDVIKGASTWDNAPDLYKNPTFQKVAGFAGDVLLDPTTYLTLGAGKGVKIGTTAGNVALTKQGSLKFAKVAQKSADKASKGLKGAEAGQAIRMARPKMEKAFLKTAKAEDIDRGGLKFLGETIPLTDKITSPIAKQVTKVSNKFGRYAGLKTNIADRRIFEHYNDVADADKAVRGRAWDKAFWGTTPEERKLMATVVERVNQSKLTGKQMTDEIAKLIPDRKLTGNNTIHNTVKNMVTEYRNILAKETKAGVIKQGREGYVYHLVKDPQRKSMMMQSYKNPSVKLGASKTRANDKFLADLGDEYETDALTLIKARTNAHIDAINRDALLKEVATLRGTKTKLKIKTKTPTAKVVNGEEVLALPVSKGGVARNNVLFSPTEFGTGSVPKVIKGDPIIGEKIVNVDPLIDKVTGERLVSIPGVKQLADVKLPEHIATYVSNLDRRLIDAPSTSKFLRGYDKVLNFWKGSVTSLFPAFHARNAASNIFTNYLDIGLMSSLNPKMNKIAAQLTSGSFDPNEIIKIAGKEWKMRDLNAAAQRSGVLQGIGYFDVKTPQKYFKLGTAIISGKDKTRLSPTLLGSGRALGRGIENQGRALNFVANLEKNGGDVLSAAERTKKFLFDYEDLGKAEREVFKRIFPFWTWTSKNMVLTAENLIKQPGKYANAFKLERSLSKPISDEERALTPDYEKNDLRIKLGTDANGNPKYMTNFGMPIEAFSDMLGNPVKSTLSMITPPVKAGIELATGTDTFTGRPINEMTSGKGMNLPGLRELSGYNQREQLINGKPKKVETVSNPYIPWLLRQTPAARFLNTFGKATDEKTTSGQKAINLLLGPKISTNDTATAEYFKNKDNLDATAKPMVRAGFLKEGEWGHYIPKNVSMTPEEHAQAQSFIDMEKNFAKVSSGNKSTGTTGSSGTSGSSIEGQSFYDTTNKSKTKATTLALANQLSNPNLSPEQRDVILKTLEWKITGKKPASLKKKKGSKRKVKMAKLKTAKAPKVKMVKVKKIKKVKLKV